MRSECTSETWCQEGGGALRSAAGDPQWAACGSWAKGLVFRQEEEFKVDEEALAAFMEDSIKAGVISQGSYLHKAQQVAVRHRVCLLNWSK